MAPSSTDVHMMLVPLLLPRLSMHAAALLHYPFPGPAPASLQHSSSFLRLRAAATVALAAALLPSSSPLAILSFDRTPALRSLCCDLLQATGWPPRPSLPVVEPARRILRPLCH